MVGMIKRAKAHRVGVGTVPRIRAGSPSRALPRAHLAFPQHYTFMSVFDRAVLAERRPIPTADKQAEDDADGDGKQDGVCVHLLCSFRRTELPFRTMARISRARFGR